MGSVHFLELALQNVSRVVWVPGFSFRSALAGQNVNSSGLGIWNFFSLSFIRFFCFLLDSAALSDSWCALILIIALHQYALLYFFSFFFSPYSGVVLWCGGLFSAWTMAVPQQETGLNSVFEYREYFQTVFEYREYFPGLHICKTNLFLAYL